MTKTCALLGLVGLACAVAKEPAAAAKLCRAGVRTPSEHRCRPNGGTAKHATLTADTGGLHYRSAGGGDVKINLGGLLQIDGSEAGHAADFAGVPAERAIARRARLQIGAFAGDTTFDAQIDTNNRQRPIADLDVGYTGLRDSVLTLGQFKQPFSFEYAQSASDLTFLERSLAFALTPGRAFGGGVSYAKDKVTVVAGVFGGNLDQAVAGPQGASFATRATYDPVLEHTHLVHFGASAAYRARDPGQSIAFTTTPESNVSNLTVLDSGSLAVANLTRGGLEFAYLNEAFRMQAEAIVQHAERRGASSVTYAGGYILAAYVLTGQVEIYHTVPDTKRRDVGYATFSGLDLSDKDLVGNGGIGAVEVAARYSTLDLGRIENGSGGRVQDVTAGLNWYPRKTLKLMLNYVHSFEDRHTNGIRPPDADIVQGRLQVFY